MTGTPIKAAIIDIDGCLTPKDFGRPLDLDSLSRIQVISRAYLRDQSIPMIVLNTGRDLNHAEMMAKMLDAFRYIIIEAGAALVSVHGAQVTSTLHPSITKAALERFEELYRTFLAEHPVHAPYLQQGKRYMISFMFETGDPAKQACAADLLAFIHERGWKFIVDEGHNFINVMFPGVNKASGLDLLFQADPELCPGNIAGVGDSTGDWDFLQHCAFSATPANGSDMLKDRCNYIAQGSEARGTLEILRHVIARNKAWLQRKAREQRVPGKVISTVITDINGTIDTAVFGNPLDLDRVARIKDLVALAGKDPAVPRVCFNTGWDVNYTLLYAQMLGAPSQHVIERGAAVVSLDGPFIKERVDPRITPAMLKDITTVQVDFISEHPRHYEHLQLGKKYSVSFQFEMGSKDKERCVSDVKAFLTSRGLELDIEDGPNFFNVGFPGIHKGTGAAMLVDMIEGGDFSSTCGIGDSDGDWAYMSRCGFTACPSNASRFLRERCDYVATKPETEGTLEILERIVEWNISRLEPRQ